MRSSWMTTCRAEAIITHGLKTLTPDLPVVAEEAASAGYLPAVEDGPFWLVDPLDGTKEFLNRNGEFTVNIALIYDRCPVLGVVSAPALDVTFAGAVGMGAERMQGEAAPQPIQVRVPPAEGLTIVASRRHGDPEALQRYLGDRRVAERKSIGSSLKFCLVAAGDADLYPRFGPTMEWDTAAGHAVLAAAGGRVTTVEGDAFLYAKPGFANPPFIAHGGS